MKLYKVTNNCYKSVFASGKYECLYKIGGIVIAPPHTLGLMCFDTLKNAIKFRNYGTQNGSILLVKAIDKVMEEKRVSRLLTELSMDDYYRGICVDTIYPPKGTVCCQSVKVIKEMTDRDCKYLSKK